MPVLRPMLAAKYDEADLDKLSATVYPCLATPKIDGIRCLKIGNKVLTRSLKPVPNLFIQDYLRGVLDGFDGELVLPGKDFNATQSAVMSVYGEPNFEYHVFDWILSPEKPYERRIESLRGVDKLFRRIKLVLPIKISNYEELIAFEQTCLAEGYEGIILRTPDSPYKFGRSTLRQFWMVKLKRFVDAEAEVLSVHELFHNDNDPTISELGYTKRSFEQAGRTPADTFGKFTVRDVQTGVTFGLGTGFTAQRRAEIWAAKDSWPGRIVTYKSLPHGVKDAPRHPVFKGERDRRDL